MFSDLKQALEKGESHFFINLIHDANSLIGRVGTAPWLVHILTRIPMPPSLNAFIQMLKFSDDMVDDRKTYEPDEPDVMSHILGAGDFFDGTFSPSRTGEARSGAV